MNLTNNTTADCVEPDGSIAQWAIFGVFMLLCFLSRFIVKMLFKAISALIKIPSISTGVHMHLLYPASFMVMLMFLYIALILFLPWPCTLQWLANALQVVLYVCILGVGFFLIKRTFMLLESVVQVFKIRFEYQVALMEGLGVTQIVVLVIVGLIFFVLIVERLFGANSGEFNTSTFLVDINLITLALCFVLTPILRDAIAGLHLLFNRPFSVGDEIEIETKKGQVERIGLFAVVIKDSTNGTMLLVPCSRFVEREYMLLRSNLCTLVQFTLPLPPSNNKKDRNLLIELETLLQAREYINVSVQWDYDNSGNELVIKFEVPKHRFNNREVNHAKFALVDSVAKYKLE